MAQLAPIRSTKLRTVQAAAKSNRNEKEKQIIN